MKKLICLLFISVLLLTGCQWEKIADVGDTVSFHLSNKIFTGRVIHVDGFFSRCGGGCNDYKIEYVNSFGSTRMIWLSEIEMFEIKESGIGERITKSKNESTEAYIWRIWKFFGFYFFIILLSLFVLYYIWCLINGIIAFVDDSKWKLPRIFYWLTENDIRIPPYFIPVDDGFMLVILWLVTFLSLACIWPIYFLILFIQGVLFGLRGARRFQKKIISMINNKADKVHYHTHSEIR